MKSSNSNQTFPLPGIEGLDSYHVNLAEIQIETELAWNNSGWHREDTQKPRKRILGLNKSQQCSKEVLWV